MEFLVRNFDSTNADPDSDRSGCRKRGMIDAVMPDDHPWGSQECLPKFVVIKSPVTQAQIDAYEGLRKVWRDNFDYTVLAARPATGQYDIRVTELNAGASGQNKITSAKATKIEGFLTGWGCTAITVGDGYIDFTFSLWNAVRSKEFWGISAEVLAELTFTLVSYVSATGIGTVKVTVPQATKPEMVTMKVTEQGGTLTVSAHPEYTFTIERSVVLDKFKKAVKERAETTYMYQQYRINTVTMDAAVTAGGTLTLTKAELVAAIRDMAGE